MLWGCAEGSRSVAAQSVAYMWLMRASVSLRSDWLNCCCRLGLPWQQAFRWLYGLVGGIVLGGGAAISECSQKLLSCLHVLLIPVNSCEGMRYSGSPAGPVSLQHNLGVASHCEIHYECQSRTRVPECFFTYCCQAVYQCGPYWVQLNADGLQSTDTVSVCGLPGAGCQLFVTVMSCEADVLHSTWGCVSLLMLFLACKAGRLLLSATGQAFLLLVCHLCGELESQLLHC